ncbi:hypothetical protein BaOVIS_028210 [Babesia ovis]|uniref:t-SNARE coiled-coil homology domain-containing protein n=1 Tax=Babesia ovis TaxID=5869 RepID=A0A9W5TC13_BABOV|nr:hypothetical protein BaOVIS_028210 [Babesia ovis]
MTLQSHPPGVEDDIVEDGVVEVIKQYSKGITQSLINALSHSVDAGKEATESLAELQSQNENLNRIKDRLNESHDNVTATQMIVDAYVNSVRWISSSISWQKATKLTRTTTDTGVQSTESHGFWSNILWSRGGEEEETAVVEQSPVKQAMEELASTTNEHLDLLIEELKSNRQKTEVIAGSVQQQNEDLERISDSAVALQDRVNQVNRVLRGGT